MTSSLGWLALDPEQSRRMMEAIDQFCDETTLDDLGFGAIRDAFSSILFFGVSSIQTRVRYVLFLPWLLQEAGHRCVCGPSFASTNSSSRGGETISVIGRASQGPSAPGITGSDGLRCMIVEREKKGPPSRPALGKQLALEA
jgi:hypothetical protein